MDRLVSLSLELAVVGPGPDQGGRVEHSSRSAVYAQRGSAHGERQTYSYFLVASDNSSKS